jgi:hypothetical protein
MSSSPARRWGALLLALAAVAALQAAVEVSRRELAPERGSLLRAQPSQQQQQQPSQQQQQPSQEQPWQSSELAGEELEQRVAAPLAPGEAPLAPLAPGIDEALLERHPELARRQGPPSQRCLVLHLVALPSVLSALRGLPGALEQAAAAPELVELDRTTLDASAEAAQLAAEKELAAYGHNLAWSREHGCDFSAVAVGGAACSHWRRGMRHWSWCALQEVAVALRGSPAEWLVVAGGSRAARLSGRWPSATLAGAVNSTRLLLLRDGGQLWRRDGGAELACALWRALFAAKQTVAWRRNMTLEMEAELASPSSALWAELGGLEVAGAAVTQGHEPPPPFPPQPPTPPTDTRTGERRPDSQPPDLALGVCIATLWVNFFFELASEANLRSPIRGRRVCPLQLRMHYARDECASPGQDFATPTELLAELGPEKVGPRYEYPPLLQVPREAPAPVRAPGAATVAAPTTARFAVVMYFTQEGRRFEKALQEPELSLPELAQHAPAGETDIAVATGPLERWEPSRAAQFSATLRRWNASLGGRLLHLQPPTIEREDLAPDLVRALASNWNCCGWSEYQKLGVLALEQYAVVLSVDVDVQPLAPLGPLLRAAASYDAVTVPDPRALSQGGLYALRPSRAALAEARRVLAAPGAYDEYAGWLGSGPLFNAVWADAGRRYAGKHRQSFALETPQGFVGWLVHVHMPRVKPGSWRHAQLEPCQFDWMQSWRIRRVHLLCPGAVAEARAAGRAELHVRIAHGLRSRGTDRGLLLRDIMRCTRLDRWSGAPALQKQSCVEDCCAYHDEGSAHEE